MTDNPYNYQAQLNFISLSTFLKGVTMFYMRSIRLLITIILTSLSLTYMLSVNSAEQQHWTGPHNYYDLSQPKVKQLLGNVEKYHLQQGIEKMHAGRYQYAWGDFEFILNYFPNHPKALMLMGDLAIKWDRPTMAEEYFQKAIEIYPNTFSTYLVYGIFFHKMNRLEDAIKNYKLALELQPNYAETHYNLGLAYFVEKKYKLANEHAQKAYTLGYPLPGLKNKLKEVGAW